MKERLSERIINQRFKDGLDYRIMIEAANSVKNNLPEYNKYYYKKSGEVTKDNHKRALALTSGKLVRLIFGLLTKKSNLLQ